MYSNHEEREREREVGNANRILRDLESEGVCVSEKGHSMMMMMMMM